MPKNPNIRKVLVIGSGPIVIGQAAEFDYAGTQACRVLKEEGVEVVLVNSNPATIMTDTDIADKVYLEPLTAGSLEKIIARERPDSMQYYVIEVNPRVSRSSALASKATGYPIAKVTTRIALGYPVLVRPSYVLGGQGMEIAYDEKHIREYMSIINMNVQEHPILVDKYLLGREIEVDAICDGENVLIPGIMEHIERAGIHSGDSISVYPPQHLAPRIQRMVTDYTINIARSLHVRGLVNIQFIEYAGDLYIIEVNPRSSRTVPYISKVTGIPIVELGVRASLGEKVPEMGFGTGLYPPAPTVAVKMPVFSFEKLPEVEVSLGPEMKSTGEALGLAETAEEAYLKGFASTKMAIPKPEEGGVLFSIADHDKREGLELAETFAALGFEIYATTGTAHRLNHTYVGAQPVPRPGEDTDKLAKLFDSGKIRLIIATPTHGRDPMRAGFRLRRMAVEYGIACVTSIDTAKLLMKCVKLGKKAEDVPPLGLHDLIL